MLERYKQSSPRTQALWKRALQIFPGGISHNLRTFGLDRSGAYPPFIKRGEGAHVWDVDGNEYVDWWMTHFSVILGHNHPKVREAVQRQLANGIHFGALNEPQVIFGEKLREAISYLEKMRFCTSGSESTMYAVRLARLFTHRHLVAKARGGWHGGNDTVGYHVTYPYSDQSFYNGVSFEFNDRESFDTLLKKHGKQLAAIIIEPVLGAGGGIPPSPEFLPYIREETETRNILLIFDEIITGFRLCFGSAGKIVFGVEPDLITLGKIVAGGMPLGAYGGREDVMALAAPGTEGGCWVGGGTFSSHPLSMVAGSATLDVLKSLKNEYNCLNTQGNQLREQVNDLFRSEGISAIATGFGSIVFLHWLKEAIEDIPSIPSKIGEVFDRAGMDLLQGLLLEQGVFGFHGLGCLSFAHSDVDIQKSLDTLSDIGNYLKAQGR